MRTIFSERRSLRPLSIMNRISSRRAGAVTTFFAAPPSSPRLRAVTLPGASSIACSRGLQLPQPFGLRDAHPAKLGAPIIVTGLRKAVFAAQLIDRHSGINLFQKTNNLLFAKSFLHVQSPLPEYWTLNRAATQIWGTSDKLQVNSYCREVVGRYARQAGRVRWNQDAARGGELFPGMKKALLSNSR